MKIAQIAPIWNKIPPSLYGGTERVVYSLTEGLVARGHQVTLFATGDSKTSARLVSSVPRSLYDLGVPWDNVSYPLYHISSAFDQSDHFDIVHMHLNFASDFISFPIVQREKIPSVFTVHFRFKEEDEDIKSASRRVLLKYRELNFVSISDSQRTIPLNFVSTVYNGIPIEEYDFAQDAKENYIAWIGRVAPEKGTKEAIIVSKKLGIPIRLTGKVDTQDKRLQGYFQKEIEPFIHGKNIRFTREIAGEEKVQFYKKAKLFLFPLNWSEPFGLVMIEAMACGTPVVAYGRGSVPEVVRDGVTGYIVNPPEADLRIQNSEFRIQNGKEWIIKKTGIDGLCEAVERIYSMPEEEYRAMRRACRKHVEENFTVEKMVDGYENVYKKILDGVE